MNKLLIFVFILSGLLISCKEDSINSAPVSISRIDDKISLINHTEETIYYYLIDRNTLALVLWAPSVSDDQPRLAPRGQARIALESITGYRPDSDTLVFNYWNGVMKDGTLQPGPVNQLLFAL